MMIKLTDAYNGTEIRIRADQIASISQGYKQLRGGTRFVCPTYVDDTESGLKTRVTLADQSGFLVNESIEEIEQQIPRDKPLWEQVGPMTFKREAERP